MLYRRDHWKKGHEHLTLANLDAEDCLLHQMNWEENEETLKVHHYVDGVHENVT